MIRMNEKFKKSVSVLMIGATLMGTTLAPISAASLSVMPLTTVNLPNALTLAGSSNKVSFKNGHTVVDTFNGVPAYYNVGNHDTSSTYSCAKYVWRYYSTIFKVNVSNMYKGETPLVSENGYYLKSINVRDAKPGDIGYHLNSTNSGGHWFIIKSADSNGLTVIEQNYKSAGATSVNINRIVPYSMTQTKDLKVFRLYKNGVDMNGGTSGSNSIVNTTDDYSGVWCFKTDSTHVINVQYKSTAQDTSRIVVDGWNGETNEVWIVTKVGNYYRISPTHEPNLALNALYGRDAKCGQYLTLHKWSNGDDASLWDIQAAPGGGVTIRNKANPNLYIDIDNGQRNVVGAKIQLWTKAGGNQVLYMERVSGTSTTTNATADYSGTYAFMSAAGYCLNVQFACKISDQAKMVIDSWNRELNEIFTITKIGNYYRISPAHAPNLALNAQYGKDAKRGQQVSLHTWRNNDDASLWSIEPTSDGGVTIRNKANPNLYLDIDNGDNGQRTVVGTRVNLWTKADTGNQTIYLQKL